jgi:hypothetical protein
MSRVAAVVASLVLATACSKKGAETTEPAGAGTGTVKLPAIRGTGPSEGGAKGATEVATGAPGGAMGADASFKLAVTPAAGPAGSPSVARISVTPSTGWHMNKEYPTKLELTAPDGVTLEKAVLEQADIAKLDDNELSFDVKLVATKAGTYKVDGELKFAVCTPDTCDPKKQTIALELVAN